MYAEVFGDKIYSYLKLSLQYTQNIKDGYLHSKANMTKY